METKYKETFAYTHKDITVWVKIDYRNNKIGLLEPTDPTHSKFQIKKYIFVDRGVEFMNGWKNILEAMDKAIDYAKKKYEANLDETTKLRQEKVVKEFNKLNKQ